MLPRGLTTRIVLAFSGVAVALMLVVGAALSLVLYELHGTADRDNLSRQVAALVVNLANNPAANWNAIVRDAGSSIANDGGFVLVQNRNGAILTLAGSPSSVAMPSQLTGTLQTSDGKRYVYVEPSADRTPGRTFLFAVPDRAGQQTAGDLIRILPIVLLVLILVGAPVAYLLSRSLTGPMRRLAQAAADLPGGTGLAGPLPLEGPTEVRALTERFNAMAYELGATRSQEAQMLANLRHDLRTPLTSIAGFAEAIADGTAAGDRATSAARTIAEEAQRLERLVGELEVVDRLRKGPAGLRPEGLDANELLREQADRFGARAASQGVAIEIVSETPVGGDGGTTSPDGAGSARSDGSTGSGAPTSSDGTTSGVGSTDEAGRLTFTGDRLAVERILQNLVDNAFSVLPAGGHIWLRAAPVHLGGRPEGISLSVTDDGPGFPPGTRSRVFERFYRADPSRAGSGSGLGLAIVRELARAHGGEAWAENVAPRGARITVFLPVAPALQRDAPAPHPGILPE
jgi:signal transduction histidine kinase